MLVPPWLQHLVGWCTVVSPAVATAVASVGLRTESAKTGHGLKMAHALFQRFPFFLEFRF
jgi:hypothetical protein